MNFLVLDGIISIGKLWKLFHLFIRRAVDSSVISKWKFVENIDGVPRISARPSEKNIVNFLEMEFSSAEWKFQRTFPNKNKRRKVKINARAWKSVKLEKCRGIEMHLIRDFLKIFWKRWQKKINQFAKKKRVKNSESNFYKYLEVSAKIARREDLMKYNSRASEVN